MPSLHVHDDSKSRLQRSRVNRRRGEIEAQIGGRSRRLVLTLAALCELEAAFDVLDLTALAERFEQGRFAARDLATIIAAGLRGAGEDVTDLAVAGMEVEGGIGGYVAIVARLLKATFAPEEVAEGEGAGPFASKRAGA